MPDMKELVGQAKAQITKQPEGTKGREWSPQSKQQIEYEQLSQHLSGRGVIQALEELKGMTGDPNARVEVIPEMKTSYISEIGGMDESPYTGRVTARLVWEEHDKTSELAEARVVEVAAEIKNGEPTVEGIPDNENTKWGRDIWAGSLAIDFAKGGEVKITRDPNALDRRRRQLPSIPAEEERYNNW